MALKHFLSYKTSRIQREQQLPRAATPLELFFDLVFVVAISAAGGVLHHAISGADANLVLGFIFVFLPIWWAWMNFTWYASAFDTDDTFHRVAAFVIMAGVITFAVGITEFAEVGNSLIAVSGFVIMRLAMVALWLRTAYTEKLWAKTAVRYALGIGVLQLFWVGRYFLPEELGTLAFVVIFFLELCVPVFAERANQTPFHREHISERYSLLTIILLGEGFVGVMAAMREAFDHGFEISYFLTLSASFTILFLVWWWYFVVDKLQLIDTKRFPYLFAYGHLVVYLSIAAIGPMTEALFDVLGGRNYVNPAVLMICFAGILGVFFVTASLMHSVGLNEWRAFYTMVVAAVLILLVSLLHLAYPIQLVLIVALIFCAIFLHSSRSKKPVP